jgi:hypothetical protein
MGCAQLLVPDGRATQPERYSLRPHRSNCVTFQRKIYVTERLSDVINFIDDLLTLTTMVEEKQPPVPDPELPATPSTPLNSDTEDAGTEEPRGDDFERRLCEVEERLRRLAPV